MSVKSEERRTALLAQVAAGVTEEAQNFVLEFLGGLALSDLEAIGPRELVASIDSIWSFAAEREPKTAKVRVDKPTWSGGGNIIEIVNDDMPFLVDSVTAAVVEEGAAVALVVHPVLTVTRDPAGLRVADGGQDLTESIMQIRLEGALDKREMASLEKRLNAVLEDVRSAVEDWQAMLRRLRVSTAEIDEPALIKAGLSADDIAEAEAFLSWMADNRFTLLGYREYQFVTVNGQPTMLVAPDSGLGILRDPRVAVFDGMRDLAALPADVRAFLEAPTLLYVAKGNAKATVHRPVPLDVIGVKQIGSDGKVVTERRFVGLFTSAAYNESPRQIPLLRRKIAQAFEQSGLNPKGHDGKSLAQILESYPRDELFQIPVHELSEISLGVLRLQERQRIAMFCRVDPFERFVSALIYVPRDRYDAQLRDRLHALVAEAYAGAIVGSYVQVMESPLARLHLIVRTTPGKVPVINQAELEDRLVEAGRRWGERLLDALATANVPAKPSKLIVTRYANAFPTAYAERFSPYEAIADIALLEATAGSRPTLRFDRPAGGHGHEVRLKLYRREQPIALSDILPILENLGFRVLTELPYRIDRDGIPESLWIQELELTTLDAAETDIAAVHALIEDGFGAVWSGAAEDDGFNQLILKAGLQWREVMMLRAYVKYLRQVGFTLSQDYIERCLARHVGVVGLLTKLFHERFNPDLPASGRLDRAAALVAEIETALDAITVLDEDRILRRLLNLLGATLRTNFFQTNPQGGAKPYLSLKLDSQAVDDLPKPRPVREIWVYSPNTEAIHLRGGLVARGGIRWSDRREDFRTEVLGLMKAQTVKNAVIVPVGSKGGFVVKKPPSSEAGRAALQNEVVACYRTMMRGLLDITDNRQAGAIVPPPRVVRHDGDDPYLVVAADKGTATFSDIANGVSRDYGFWLDDAFASGGSAGYDHKAMGITARGAWVAVERHFREAGVNLAKDSITVVGVGDMAGDVFGNGLLHSNRLKLLAAFNHLHIFLDPEPDPATSFTERQRLFNKPGSSWTDYDPTLISAGGGVFERNAKTIKLSPRVQHMLGIAGEVSTPNDVIQAILKAPVDLLWFGGIGTYVKADAESNAQVGDRANDALRVNGADVRARVIGEGANLGVTQRGRIEYAALGGRIDTDAIDNSAGVDTSDHEVNLKILLSDPVGRGALTIDARNSLLASMTDEVAAHVLRDNYLQTFALSAAMATGPAFADSARALMRALEREVALDRALDALPDDAVLANRRSAGLGVHRPELSVLIGWAKIAAYNAILPSALPDDPTLERDLEHYFPARVRAEYPTEIKAHGLRRELIATIVTNELLNRGGIAFVSDLEYALGVTAPAIARAFLIARDLLGLPGLWAGIEELDGAVSAGAIDAARQLALYREVAAGLEAAVRWLIGRAPSGTIGEVTARLAPAIADLDAALATGDRVRVTPIEGVPEALARGIAVLAAVTANLDVLSLAERAGVPVGAAAAGYFEAGERFGLAGLKTLAAAVPTLDRWGRQAVDVLLGDLGRHQQALAARLLAEGPDGAWLGERADAAAALAGVVTELKTGGAPDLARLTVAEHMVRRLVG